MYDDNSMQPSGGKGEWGKNQGDMKPHVEDYSKPYSCYSQDFQGKTTQYIARNNQRSSKMASDVKKQNYHGRYE